MLNEYQLNDLKSKLKLTSLNDIIITSDESCEISSNVEPVTYTAMETKNNGKVWCFEITPKRIKNLYEIKE